MKTWPVLFALIVAGTCGAQAVVADLAKARSPFESENGGTWFGLDDLTSGSRMKQLVQGGGFLAQRYELVATLSTRSHCLAIRAEGEARTIVDQLGIHWCSNATMPRHPGSQRPALAKIQFSTQLLRVSGTASRETC